jgi:hypothetical protein
MARKPAIRHLIFPFVFPFLQLTKPGFDTI